MEYQEFSGKNIDEALTNATVRLGVTSDKLEYEVVEKGSSGIFGFASKDAVIKARIKEEKVEKPEKAEEETLAVLNESERNYTGESLSADVVETAKELASNFINGVCKEMNIEVEIKFFYDEINNSLDIELLGPDMGILIGKRGATLDSLQYLTNLAVNRKIKDFVHVTIDTENYRERRKKTLENLAHNVAYRVRKTEKTVVLESMNAYERRVIHAALSDDPSVNTHSEGEEPYRHVVVTLK
jgi:spoIIIJ-associated protein